MPTSSESPKEAPADEERVKRPPNAWILYRQYHHPHVTARYPGIHNSQVSKIISSQWQAMTDHDKKPWYQRARARAEEHKRLHPDWKYHPSQEKSKRRQFHNHQIQQAQASQAVQYQEHPLGVPGQSAEQSHEVQLYAQQDHASQAQNVYAYQLQNKQTYQLQDKEPMQFNDELANPIQKPVPQTPDEQAPQALQDPNEQQILTDLGLLEMFNLDQYYLDNGDTSIEDNSKESISDWLSEQEQ
ncbi:high mobility group box domain-containing protein [Xylariaceae sp. FL1651]|nr:high mobility group box domain-containing protein [Xylariaceae sp. FL1651]